MTCQVTQLSLEDFVRRHINHGSGCACECQLPKDMRPFVVRLDFSGTAGGEWSKILKLDRDFVFTQIIGSAAGTMTMRAQTGGSDLQNGGGEPIPVTMSNEHRYPQMVHANHEWQYNVTAASPTDTSMTLWLYGVLL